MSKPLQLSQLTVDVLLLMYGATQIEAMLWRLDHMKSARTSIDQEFEFITDRSLQDTPFEHKREFLKSVKTGYIDYLKITHEQQDAIKQQIKTQRHVAESV